MYETFGYKQKLERQYDLKIFTDNVEFECLEQTENLLKQEVFKKCKVRLMPDTHAGKGAVIGFTADLADKVIPNIVGVDIGCGMLCVPLGDIEINLKWIDEAINKYVPAGRESHKERQIKFPDIKKLHCFRELKDTPNFEKQLGTLGGGNHFIEIDIDDGGNKYLVIHTGSRNMGKQVAEYYQNLAIKLHSGYDEYLERKQETIDFLKSQGRRKEIESALKELNKKFQLSHTDMPKDLCYLTREYREQYLHDMKICQQYAVINRNTIARIILKHIDNTTLPEAYLNNSFDTIHNYINFEDNIIRKGAISAYEGEKVLIPMNMRDGSLICIGRGNPDWNYSAPHGAGRIMSRGKAKENISMKEYIDSMQGIYTTSVNQSTIDEAPMVYKPMQEIIDNIKDTVNIFKIIKPIYNFKSSE